MAKELPWFKWSPSKWDTGNIQMCSHHSKGIFSDLCSLYWSRVGELPYALALQRICKGDASALQELSEYEIFRVEDGFVRIDFLDEQLAEFGQASDKRRKAAEKRWSGHVKKENDASALQVHMQSNAIKRRGEETREEDIETQPDFFESNAHAYMLLSGNYHDTDAAKKIVANNGWPTAGDPDIKALIHHFIETQVDVRKQGRDDIRSHLRRWLNKQPVDKMREWAKNILENHARRGQRQGQGQKVEISGNAGQVPESG